MRTVGGLILLVSIAMIVAVGTIAVSDLTGDAQQNNDSAIASQATGAASTISPIITVLGFLVLIVGVMVAVNAFR